MNEITAAVAISYGSEPIAGLDSRGKMGNVSYIFPRSVPRSGKYPAVYNHRRNFLIFFSILHLLSRVLLSRLKEFCASRSAIQFN